MPASSSTEAFERAFGHHRGPEHPKPRMQPVSAASNRQPAGVQVRLSPKMTAARAEAKMRQQETLLKLEAETRAWERQRASFSAELARLEDCR